MTHVRSSRYAAAGLVALTLLAAAEWRPRAAGTITGVVFEDFNGNGLRDTTSTVPNGGGATGTTPLAVDRGLAGVTVSAYDGAGALQGTAVSDATGAYSLVATGTGPYRIEFTGLPANYWPSAHGLGTTGSGTTVQFVPDGNSSNVNLGLIEPSSFCQNNPTIYTSCFVFDDQLNGPNNTMPVFVDFPYSAGANTNTPADYFLPASHNLMVPANGLGTVFGLGFHRPTNRIYAAAFMKKHAGYGPGGPGAIYTIDPSTLPGGAPALYADLDAIFGAGTSGGDAHAGNGGDYNADGGNVTWDAVGKTSFGGLEVSPDGQYVFVVNLADRQVYRLPAAGTPTVANIVRTPIPVPATAVPANGADLRPFALQYHRGLLYVGMVNSAESTQLAANLRAYVYTLDPATMAFGAAPVFEFALNYPRGYVQNFSGTSSAVWNPWRPTFATVPGGGVAVGVYPQPMLSGLAFDVDGNLTIGIRDRAGDQFGFFTFDNPALPSQVYEGVSGGDTLFAEITTPGNLASGWTLESNAATSRFGPTAGAGNAQGPGGGEFYVGETYLGNSFHQELSGGALLQLPGFPDVLSSAFDPGRTVRTGGFIWMRQATGARTKGYDIYSSGNPPAATFSKANGFGEMVQICQSAPLEIGNRVWIDADADGVQDAGELGLDGVTVQLIAPGGGVVGTAVTANGGQYYFSSAVGTSTGNAIYGLPIQTLTQYRIRIDMSQPALATYGLSTPNADGSTNGDSRDSDASLTGVLAEVLYTTGKAGENDHTIDIGVVPPSAALLSLGNLVWLDVNDNGVVDGGENGITGVTVRLIAANGTTELANTVTDGTGRYLFTNLTAGSYFVEVDRTSPALGSLRSSTDIATSANPDTDVDNDDNGVTISAGAVRSGAVTLSLNGEPTNDGDADNNSNLSVDFGFVPDMSLGNLVWSDVNDNGVVDPGENGIAGVSVRLIAADGTTVRATTVTNGSGLYLFTGLTPGTYFVEVVPPANSTSSTDIATSANPDNDVDNDDNGVTIGAGVVRSGAVTLSLNGEPTNDGDANANSNLTVDFGFVPGGLLSLGNLVWIDLNNNGLADSGEPGVAGATVRLLAANGTTVLGTTTTNGSGNYLFAGLSPGTYVVEVDRGGPLAGYLSSTDIASSPTPNNDVDNDDNGVAVTSTAVRSGAVTLSNLGEPTTDGDNDPNSNLTVDFGFIRSVSLGNLVWLDVNDNGLADPGETGLGGITVRLIAADGVTVLATTLTDASGRYLFAGLLPGTFYVEVVQPGGVRSSTDIASSGNPNNDTDNDDNGVFISGGTVRSGAVTLGFGQEPTNDGDTSADSNLTVDFGFVPDGGGGFETDICLQQVVPATVLPGGQMVATYTATNHGPGVALDLIIDGMLPAGVTVAATSPSPGGVCTATPDMLECRWAGTTPAGATRSVAITFQVSPSIPVGTPIALWFMTSANGSDPYPACNMVDSYVFVGGGSQTPADLVLTASATSAGGTGTAIPVAVGQPMSARFTVTNPSTVPARGQYVLLLDEAGLIDVTRATWSPQGWVAATNSTSATWETGPIAPGAAVTLDLAIVPRTATTTRLQLVRVEGQPVDPNAANDQVDLVFDGVGTGSGRWVAAGNLDGAGVDEIITGTGAGETPQVRVFSSAGVPLSRFFAFDRAFRGGVRVASCDVDNDGVDELVAAQGPGGGRVRVLSMAAGYVSERTSFNAFEPSFTGGVNVACGDVDGDGRAEVVVGPDGGRAPDVRIFAINGVIATVAAQFQAYEPAFTGGVRVSAARFAGSPLVGAFNVVTAPGPGRAGDIRVWSVVGASSSLVASAPLAGSSAGAHVLLADVDGDASLDLLVAPDAGAPALVQVFRLSTGALLLNAAPGTGGIRSLHAAVGRFGGAPELVVGRGPGETPGILSVGVGSGVSVRLAFTALEQP